MGHSWSLWPRRLCWAWCQCAPPGFPSPSWQTSGFLWVPYVHAFWNPLHGCTCECWWCILSHHHVDGGPALLLTALLCRSHPAGPGLERNTLFLKDFFGTDRFWSLYCISSNIASAFCFGSLDMRLWDLSSQTRDWSHSPCIGRWSLNHWTTREVPEILLDTGVDNDFSGPQRYKQQQQQQEKTTQD